MPGGAPYPEAPAQQRAFATNQRADRSQPSATFNGSTENFDVNKLRNDVGPVLNDLGRHGKN
jgi:hypothetical protein